MKNATENQEKLRQYLLGQYTRGTVRAYLNDIGQFLLYMSEDRASKARYRDILLYVDYLRKKYRNPRTVHRILSGVKSYYSWLLASGQRNDHPCRRLGLRDGQPLPVQLQDLFKAEELELLLEREERYPAVKIKNQVIIGLLIYQALKLNELTALKTSDIDLQKGTVRVAESVNTNTRTLKLKSGQVMLLFEYLQQVRPRLLKTETEYLLLNLRGRPQTEEDIMYLIGTYRPLFPERNLNTTTIRQSVLTNMLKAKKDLRVVQAFAGHRRTSTTEKYRQSGLEELKDLIAKYHPLR